MKRLAFLFLMACSSTPAATDGGGIDSGTDGPAPKCGSIVDLQIATLATNMWFDNPLDPLGYPPYAAEGCALVYVASDGTLVLRDLAANMATNIAPAAEKPRRPSIAGGTIAWEATMNGASVVRWRDKTGHVDTITGSFTSAGEPRAAKDAIAFTAWLSADPKGDTDVLLFATDTKTITLVGTGPAQQRFADIDATRVAYADFIEAGPNGAFDAETMADAGYTPADITVFDRAAKTKTERKLAGKQAFPLLVKDSDVAYLDWGTSVRPMPKFFEYDFKLGQVTGDPNGDRMIATVMNNAAYIRPGVKGDAFEWVSNGALWRRPVDLSAAESTVQTFTNNAYASVSSDLMVIVAVGTPTNVSLVGVSR